MLDDLVGQSSEQAFDDLYSAALPLVYRYTTARLGVSDGEEVTADVFHAAALAFRNGRQDEVTIPWLMSVARNKVIDRWRREGRRKAKAHLLRPRKDQLAEFPADWSADPRREDVIDALDKVSDRHRALLILKYVDGMTVPELAAALDTSIDSLDSALARARESFRKHYRTDVTR